MNENPHPGLVHHRRAHRPRRGGGARRVRAHRRARRRARRDGDRLPAGPHPGRVAALRDPQARRHAADHRRQHVPQPERRRRRRARELELARSTDDEKQSPARAPARLPGSPRRRAAGDARPPARRRPRPATTCSPSSWTPSAAARSARSPTPCSRSAAATAATSDKLQRASVRAAGTLRRSERANGAYGRPHAHRPRDRGGAGRLTGQQDGLRSHQVLRAPRPARDDEQRRRGRPANGPRGCRTATSSCPARTVRPKCRYGSTPRRRGPAQSPAGSRPAILWIHGGGYMFGTGLGEDPAWRGGPTGSTRSSSRSSTASRRASLPRAARRLLRRARVDRAARRRPRHRPGTDRGRRARAPVAGSPPRWHCWHATGASTRSRSSSSSTR